MNWRSTVDPDPDTYLIQILIKMLMKAKSDPELKIEVNPEPDPYIILGSAPQSWEEFGNFLYDRTISSRFFCLLFLIRLIKRKKTHF